VEESRDYSKIKKDMVGKNRMKKKKSVGLVDYPVVFNLRKRKSRPQHFFITFCHNCDVTECDWWKKTIGPYISNG